jgi:hypothetical protein
VQGEIVKTYPQLLTMKAAFKEICEGETPWVALGNLTNVFFDEPGCREELFKDPIEEPAGATPEIHKWAVFCAASVEFLCQKYGLACPDWVHDSGYAPLEEPWFHLPAAGLCKPEVREEVRQETPEPFARRNIFCGDRIYLNKREEAEKLRQKLAARRRELQQSA